MLLFSFDPWSRQKYQNIFVRFLVQVKTVEFAYEINWHLAHCMTYIKWLWFKVRKKGGWKFPGPLGEHWNRKEFFCSLTISPFHKIIRFLGIIRFGYTMVVEAFILFSFYYWSCLMITSTGGPHLVRILGPG